MLGVLLEFVMIIRRGDMGNGATLSLEACGQGNYLIMAGSGSRNELGEYRFVEFTRSGSKSPETCGVLAVLRQQLMFCGQEDRRGIISYETEGGCLQVMQDKDGDEYVRTVGLGVDTEVRPLRLTPQNTSELVRETIINLLHAMRVDEGKYPQ